MAVGIAFLLGLIGVVAGRYNIRENFGDSNLISIHKNEITDVVHDILTKSNIDNIGQQQAYVHLKIPKETFNLLINEDILFQDITEEYLSNMERNLNSNDFVCEEGAQECADKSSDEFFSTYQKLDTLYKRYENMAASNPSLTSFETLGFTYEKREQKVLWIGDDGKKPIVYYFCAIHAREWITPMYCAYMAEQILDQTNEVGQELLANYTFAITPVGNVDGYVYTHEVDNAWRKTRKPNENSRCVGTDPNRNYATGFGGTGGSSNPCSETYRGTSPFDQNCTKNIKTFTDKYASRIIHVNDVHAYGEYWMSPFAGTADLPDDIDKYNECNVAVFNAIKEVSGLEFTVGPFSTALYLGSGASIDYFYAENGITHAYTFEARGGGRTGLAGFQPPTSNIMPSNIELFAGFYAAMKCIYNQEILQQAPVTGCKDNKANCNSLSCFQDETSCKETCGLCDVPNNVDDPPLPTIEVEKINTTALTSAIFVLAIILALFGIATAFIVHKYSNKTASFSHYEL